MVASKEIKEIQVKVSTDGVERARKKIEELNKSFDRAMEKQRQAEAREKRIANRQRQDYKNSNKVYKNAKNGPPEWKMKKYTSGRGYHQNTAYFKEMEKRFAEEMYKTTKEYKTKQYLAGKGYHQNTPYFKEMEKRFAEEMYKTTKEYKTKQYLAGEGTHQNTTYMKWMEKKFQQGQEERAPKPGRVFKQRQKTSEFIDSQFSKKKSDPMKKMKDYYSELERTTKAEAVRAERIENAKRKEAERAAKAKKREEDRLAKEEQRQAKARAREEQRQAEARAREERRQAEAMRKKAEKERKAKEKEYSDMWKAQEAQRLHIGKQQSSDYFARAKSNMKKYKKRVAEEEKRMTRDRKILKDAPMNLRNSIGSLATVATQAVGELTMFAGAISMVGFMGANAFAKLMQVGEAFGVSEKNFLVTAGFRQSLIQKGGKHSAEQFDKANRMNMFYSGLNEMASGAQLARAGTMIRELKGSVTGKALSDLTVASHGSAILTGEDSEKTMSKVLEVARKGKDAYKLGIADLKLTKNINENIALIADAIRKDPIANTVLRRGTVETAMTKIKSSPQQLLGRLMEEHPEQISRIFNKIGNTIFDAFGGDKDSNKVVNAWSRVLTNMEEVASQVFTKEKVEDALVGASRWSAELVVIGGKLMNGTMWFLSNSDLILDSINKFGKMWLALQAIKIGAGAYKVLSDVYGILRAVDITSSQVFIAQYSLIGAIASLGVGLSMAYNDFIEGGRRAQEWGVGETNAKLSSLVAGTDGGVYGALKNAAKWGMVGAGAGAFFGPMGALIGGAGGALFGGLTGYIGGKELSQDIHKNMYGVPATPLDRSVMNYADRTPRYEAPVPAFDNPNQRTIVVHGNVNLDSSYLHIQDERWMRDSAGIVGGAL